MINKKLLKVPRQFCSSFLQIGRISTGWNPESGLVNAAETTFASDIYATISAPLLEGALQRPPDTALYPHF